MPDVVVRQCQAASGIVSWVSILSTRFQYLNQAIEKPAKMQADVLVDSLSTCREMELIRIAYPRWNKCGLFQWRKRLRWRITVMCEYIVWTALATRDNFASDDANEYLYLHHTARFDIYSLLLRCHDEGRWGFHYFYHHWGLQWRLNADWMICVIRVLWVWYVCVAQSTNS